MVTSKSAVDCRVSMCAKSIGCCPPNVHAPDDPADEFVTLNAGVAVPVKSTSNVSPGAAGGVGSPPSTLTVVEAKGATLNVSLPLPVATESLLAPLNWMASCPVNCNWLGEPLVIVTVWFAAAVEATLRLATPAIEAPAVLFPLIVTSFKINVGPPA